MSGFQRPRSSKPRLLDLVLRPSFPTACGMKDLDSGGGKSAKTAGNLTSIFPTVCGMQDLDSGGAKSAKTAGLRVE